MRSSSRLTTMIAAIILIGGALIIAGLSGYTYYMMSSAAETAAEDSVARTASMLSSRFESDARPIVRVAENISRYDGLSSHWILYEGSVESARFYEFLTALLRSSPQLSSIGVMLDPVVWSRSRSEVSHAPFAIRSADSVLPINLAPTYPDHLDSELFVSSSDDKRMRWEVPTLGPAAPASPACLISRIQGGLIICSVLPGWIDSVMKGVEAPYGGEMKLVSRGGHELYRTPQLLDEAAATRYSAEIPSMGLTLEVLCPSGEIGAEARISALKMFGAGMAAVIVITLFVSSMTSSVTRAIVRMAKRIDTIAPDGAHDLTMLEGNAPCSEIEALSQSIENMHLNLSKAIAGEERELAASEKERMEADVARIIAKKFFAPPGIEGARFSVASRCDQLENVSGIFFETQKSNRGTVYIAVGEISSSGVPAVLTVSSVLSYIRSVLFNCPEPNSALSRVVQLMSMSQTVSGGSEKIKILLAEFYPSTGTCVLASAGYPNVMLLRGGSASNIDLPVGRPLFDGDFECSPHILNMNSADSLLFYTSSLAEDKPASESRLATLVSLALESERSCADAVRSLKLPSDGAMVVLQYRL